MVRPFVLLLATSSLCWADALSDRFTQLDLDRNGLLSQAETTDAPYLLRLDQDQDGAISLDEARAGIAKLTGQRAKENAPTGDDAFQRLDKNQDGRISPDELPRASWMARIDEDEDGFASPAETAAALAKLTPERIAEIAPLFSPAKKEAPPTESPDLLADSPTPLKGSDFGVGRRVADITLTDLEGIPTQLMSHLGTTGLVLGFFTPDCPMSAKLGPEMKRLETTLPASGIAVCWVCPVPTVDIDELRTFATQHELNAPVLSDSTGALVRALQASTTTESFLIDASQTLLYRGAINDQYGLTHQRDTATHAYLRDAVTALKDGRPIAVSATTSPGCALDLKAEPQMVKSNTTYHREISRIVQANCIECHREGGLGPFSLETYDDIIDNAGMIRRQVERRNMPPWFADTPPANSHLQFSNDRSLSDHDRETLLSWLASNRPLGDPAEAPTPRTFPSEWMIGTPDAVFQIAKPVAIKAEGEMPYYRTVVQTNLDKDRWVQGYEVQPGDRGVVHHVIIKVHPAGEPVRRVGDGQEGYWAAYVPGNSSRVFPDGHARLLPAGAQISFQIHYTPNGKATTDQTRIGLVFADSPPEYEVKVLALANPRISIPAGAENHMETMERRIPKDLLVSGFMAHMHNRGAGFRYELVGDDGTSTVLLNIPRYDFNWQLPYHYATPQFIPAGSQVRITAVYDNSVNNPANPDPSKNVRWGEQTWEEMMIGYVEHYVRRDTDDVAENEET